MRRRATVFWLMLVMAGLAAPAAASATPQLRAPQGPGEIPTWTRADKDGVGTALRQQSKVWFTLEGGRLTEVYYPRLDTAQVRSLQFAVSDGKRVWTESQDTTHRIEQLDTRALLFRQTNSCAAGHFTIAKTYATDPQRNTLLIDVSFDGPVGDALYLLYRPALENSGYGNTGLTQAGALVAMKAGAASALVASGGFSQSANGFVGVNDGLTDLLLHHHLQWHYAAADGGNVMQTARIAGPRHFTLALSFAGAPDAAVAAARASLQRGFAAVRSDYARDWHAYVSHLRRVAAPYETELRLAAMVVRAHEDKTYPGAIIASMSVPWGDAVSSANASVGGYHLVWSRDLYEAATALMAVGDRATAKRALHYLLDVQQRADGSFPQNSWLGGKPYWPSLQMDEQAYPIILAWQLGVTDAATWKAHLRPAAQYIVTHGPATPQERWEEESGYSPSTLAAEIAGLVCAAAIARTNHAAQDARRYLATADAWRAHLQPWLVTTSGHLGGAAAKGGYYIRIDNNRDPNDGFALQINNGGGTWDERDVVDQGFLELVRFGIVPAADPTIVRSLRVIDATIRVETPSGPGFYRYNHDGYGETIFGGPYQGKGVGRLWPLLAGERGEYEVARGKDPRVYLDAMLYAANDGGMISEQVWDRAEPTGAGFRFGKGTCSATPLVWSMAQYIRLAVDAAAGRVVEQPAVVAARFLRDHDVGKPRRGAAH